MECAQPGLVNAPADNQSPHPGARPCTAATACTLPPPPCSPPPASAVRLRAQTTAPRLLILGGGWGGLAAARELRRLLPAAEITLVDRSPQFFSRPLSNRWLVGQAATPLLQRDLAASAQAHGYRFVAAEVHAVDRLSRPRRGAAPAPCTTTGCWPRPGSPRTFRRGSGPTATLPSIAGSSIRAALPAPTACCG